MEMMSVGTDWRLLGCAYVDFFVQQEKESLRLLEEHPLDLSISLGRLAYVVTDQVLFPCVYGVPTDTSYQVVDALRRADPEFGAAWVRRSRYRRQGMGITMRPVRRSRRCATDIARMLCRSWAHEHDTPKGKILVCDIVPAMLHDLRLKLCHLSEDPADP
ncbi:hypothetical protein ACF06W_11380 [Streptomyces albus]|uniref:hypothetical protein n=1 Tax=Streptomyces albus TaxID=1888 RepID=UPI0036FD6F29